MLARPLWPWGVFLFTQLLFEVFVERQCEIMFFLQHTAVSFRSGTLQETSCWQGLLTGTCGITIQILRTHSLHFILIIRVWHVSSYWTQTRIVKIWLAVPLKISHTSLVLWCAQELCARMHSLIKTSDSGLLAAEVLIRWNLHFKISISSFSPLLNLLQVSWCPYFEK